MKRVLSIVGATLLAVAALPIQAPADVMNFKLLTRYSQAASVATLHWRPSSEPLRWRVLRAR